MHEAKHTRIAKNAQIDARRIISEFDGLRCPIYDERKWSSKEASSCGGSKIANGSVCGNHFTTSLNTTYNDVAGVPPYTGIMFEIFSRSNIEILTFELDLQMENATDLSVEIYSLERAYASNVHNESAWELVANTVAVPAPKGNGVIVPVNYARHHGGKNFGQLIEPIWFYYRIVTVYVVY
jgi:hypothetical protein